MRRGRSRIPEEIVQALESDRAQVVREIVDDAGERAARLAEEAASAARRRVLPAAGSVVAVLLRRRVRGRGRRRTAVLILLLGAAIAIGIALAARGRRSAGEEGEAGERAMDDALVDSFPASDPPAPATAPSL